MDRDTRLMQWHSAIELFDYNLAVDWAIELIRKRKETENILILASFSKPVDSDEIKLYVSGALNDLNLEEKYGTYSLRANAHYYVELILDKIELRLNLRKLYKMYINSRREAELVIFFLLHHAWLNLEADEWNPYYKGATLENIETVIMKEARNWIDKYVDKEEN